MMMKEYVALGASLIMALVAFFGTLWKNGWRPSMPSRRTIATLYLTFVGSGILTVLIFNIGIIPVLVGIVVTALIMGMGWAISTLIA